MYVVKFRAKPYIYKTYTTQGPRSIFRIGGGLANRRGREAY